MGRNVLLADLTLHKNAGVVRQWHNLPPYNDEVSLWHLSAALTVNGSVGEGGDNSATSGGSSQDLSRAKLKLAGEAVERYALAVGPHSVEICRQSWNQLAEQRQNALDPATLPVGDGSVDNARREQCCAWVRAEKLKDGAPGWVPEQLVSVPHRFVNGEPLWRAPISTGAAAHTTRAAAIRAALAEVIERDAFQTAWLLGAPLPSITEFRRSRSLQWVLDACRRLRLQVDLRRLPAVSAAHMAVLAVVRDESGVGPRATVAAKAELSEENAPQVYSRVILGALEEALQIRHWMRRVLDREGPLEAIGPVDTLLVRARHWLTPRPNRVLNDWLASVPEQSRNAEAKNLIDPFEDAWVVALTPRLPPELIAIGWSVVKVVIPQCQPLNLTDSAADLSPAAIQRVAASLGLPGQTLLQREPHPFL
jgi:ribosomal protein S12 methylthiotransferase accessory factor